MKWLSKALTTVLVVSSTAVVSGINACLTGDYCESGGPYRNFQDCSIADADMDDLRACFESIGRSTIEVLYLSGNALTTIPSDLFEGMSALKTLSLRENDITTIDVATFQPMASTLYYLELQENQFTTLPSGVFGGLGSLHTLRLDDNQLTTLAAGIFDDLANLDTMYLYFNELTSIPSDLFEGTSAMTRLSLIGNDITAINGAAFQPMASTLTRLYISDNHLTTLPSGVFAGMGSLHTLSLFDNELATLPSDVFDDLAKLEKLYLNNNLITTLPSFAGLEALEYFNLIATINPGVFAGLQSRSYVYLYDNLLTTLPSFAGLEALEYLDLHFNLIATIDPGAFAGMDSLSYLSLYQNKLTTLPAGAFASLDALQFLYLYLNDISTLPSGAFAGLGALKELHLYYNDLTALPSGVFGGLEGLEKLSLFKNELKTLPSDVFAGMGSLLYLYLQYNEMTALDVSLFESLASVRIVNLGYNELTTLPAGVFENIGSGTSLQYIVMTDNPDLQCVPTNFASGSKDSTSTFDSTDHTEEVITAGLCECTPTDVAMCDEGFSCSPGADGYTCDADTVCAIDSDCDTDAGEECCPLKLICEIPDATDPGACGDPHMTGFRGQKFDFTGEDGGWYAVVSDLPYLHLNMRVTAPVPSLPEITYITGISVSTADADGVYHSIVISVKEPHSMDSACTTGMFSCLAEGALHVVVDGEEVMLTPDTVTIAPDVAMAAVNLPGACRSFGFEQYWERKKHEYLAQPDRKLDLVNGLQDMSDWVLADPTATNMVECAEYVGRVTVAGDVGLFDHQSEHVSFQIMTPTTTIRLSHGKLHQLPMRDPTDQYDLPDHLAWQMNLAIDHSDMNLDATGILGETLVPTLDEAGASIMHGMGAIRGAQEDYRVSGPLEVFFAQDGQHEE